MNTKRAQDQARPAPPQGPEAEGGAAAGGTKAHAQRNVPLAGSGRRWSVRVHWGIVFAIVASLILWLAIKTVVGLAF